MFELENTPQPESNYPIDTDTEFTPDEIESIKDFKANLLKKRDKNRAILRGLESSFWGISSYSLCRFLVLTSGISGLPLAIAASILMNNIVNRDCLDSFNVNKNSDGWEVNGMGKILKFGISTIVASLAVWGAVGDIVHLKSSSESTYQALEQTVEDFNKLPEKNQNNLLIIGGIVIAGGLVVIVGSRK
jgi:hypothetical protein